jgi:adenosylcobyric acid synthase
MAARTIFVGGTSSNAGKSFVATAICAWLRLRGVAVAPFKAQNMSNHSFPCAGRGEIGRAQAAQAEACGLPPEPSMNPILLKPNGDGTSQVVVNGRVWKTLPARGYYEHYELLLAKVLSAYEELSRRFELVVIEGAGSVSELNLRPFDLVNLGLVTRIGSPWVLVADIERGGVFASVLGTVSLLSPEERRLFRGFLINKFRGDRSLFDEGVGLLESRTGAPCLGVFPFADYLRLDAEDSLALAERPSAAPLPGARIAIVRLPRLSNGTDFRLLSWAEWLTEPRHADFDFVILPGTKDTISDLRWLRAQGLDRFILDQHRRGATIVGICGGYQMLGSCIRDPHGVESGGGSAAGLGLLPVDTVLSREKTTRSVSATTPGGASFAAYEIHMGVTTALAPLPPFARLEDGSPEGVRAPRLVGTYLHGALEQAAVANELFGTALADAPTKESEYLRMAEWFGRHARKLEEWLP